MQLRAVAAMFRFRRQVGRNAIIAFALLFNTFTWYYLGQGMITQIASAFAEGSLEHLLLMLAYPVSIIVSGIVGSIFLVRVTRSRLFYAWLLLGVFAATFLAVPAVSPLISAFLVTLIGISVGFGTPACLNYFAESVLIENRGKVGGLILLMTLGGASLLSVVVAPLSLSLNSLFFGLWRAWSLPFPLFALEGVTLLGKNGEKRLPFASVLHNRTFLLYFTAWFMFSLVDSFETVILNLAVGQFGFLISIEPIIASLSALATGVISDWIGRKRILIFGFMSLGIGYAVIGLLPQIWVSWLLYYVTDGLALGSLTVLFVLVLWGELSQNGSEKFYAIGETPYFLTGILYIVLTPYLSSIPATSIFSLAAFFLFLAVLPLLYAAETLPEKKIRDRELKMYIGEAKKVREKYA
jgi:MFS family permease